MSCPRCGCPLENYSNQEGGWCPDCEEWYPPDLVEEPDGRKHVYPIQHVNHWET